MRTRNVSTRLFRIFGAMIVLVMAFSQVTGGARAGGPLPPGKERVNITPVSLNELQNYYGPLGEIKGPVGVVVELEDTPAALIYAQSSEMQAAALTINQIDVIQQKQAYFMTALQAKGVLPTELFRTQKVYNGIWLRVDAKDLVNLASIPGVKALHPIIPKTIDNTTSVPLIGAPQVWGGSGTYQGTGIKIGIIDTGIDYIHTNFGGTGIYTGQDYTTLGEPGNLFPTAKVVGGWDFAGDAYNADSTSASYSPIPVPDPDPMDCYGHGSHVAGSAAGFGVNTDGTTYVEAGADTYAALKDLTSPAYIAKFRIGPGVAPKAELYSLRIFGCAGSTDLTEQAIEWAMDPNNDGDLSDHLDVINMSLGSNFGSEYDTSAVASNNAAQAGVVVVAASGNANDVYYITSAPAVARYAISVASSVDAGAVVSAFEVTATTAPTPLVPVGTYPASEAVFGPQSYALSGALAYASPANGCDPALPTNSAYPLTGVSGKIALIDRGICSFDVKVKNAQLGGALGVLIVNNVNTFPITMGGSSASLDATITIPAMMTTKAIGDSLKTDILAGTVTALLTTAHRNAFVMTDPTIVDTVSSFSSRGPARAGTLLKPDITAPGDTIFSTMSGSGNQGANFSGTSMATPHVAGVMALLKQIHPTWTVAELKALAMNTATNDLWTSTAHTAKHTPTRVGAGRVNAANAALSSVIAYNATDPGQVSLAFGEQAVLGTQSFVKSIIIKNTGVASAPYNVTFDSRYQANLGLTFTLLNASDTALSNPVTVPASGMLEIKVKITAVATALTRARDATIATTNARQRFSEGGGYVTLTSTGTDPTLRVPVHIAARPASAMSVTESWIHLPAAATGTFYLTPSGTPVDTTDDTSKVSILELLGTSPNESSSSGINNAADLHYIGATSDYPSYTFADSAMYFGITTYGKWDTPSSVEFDVYIDVNEDGVYDYVVFNYNYGSLATGATDDVMLTTYCKLPGWTSCNFDYYTNGLSGTYNTNIFNNNVMVLPVGLTSIGLVDSTNTNFNFYVASSSRDAVGAVDVSDVMHYDVAHQAFTAVSAAYGMPMWADALAYSPTFAITYDKAAIAADHSKGLLLLHHHNAANTAEVLSFSVPVANDQSVSTPEDTAKAITLTATDVEGDPLTYSVVAAPSHGVLTGSAPTLTYTPAANYNGPDSFTFKANDGTVDSNIATVSITVTPVNDAPVANGQYVSTFEDTAKAITLTATDVEGDPLTYSVVAAPLHGVLTGSAPALTYTPAANYNGPDSFTFKANDGKVDSNIATVSITVNAAVNHAPVITSNGGGLTAFMSVAENTTAVTTVTATDSDGDTLTYSISGGADAAFFSINASTGVLTFISAPDFENPADSGANNTYQVAVQVSDGTLTDTQYITVTVTDVNESCTLFMPLINR